MENLKDFLDEISKKIEKTDEHLNNITKTILFISFISFITLYYPDFNILDTPIKLSNDIVPISIMFLLSLTFAMWGYYLWRLNKQKIIQNKYLRAFYRNTTSEQKIDINEIYKIGSTSELLYNWESKTQMLPILFMSLILATNHTAFILNSIYFFGKTKYGAMLITVLVVSIFICCYVFYFNRMKELYKKSLKSQDEFIIVKYISVFNILFTLLLILSILLFKKPDSIKNIITTAKTDSCYPTSNFSKKFQ